METNEPKKPKRPRIQQTPGMESTGAEHNSYDKGSYNADRQQGGEGMQGGYNPEGQRPYQRNSYGQGGYQPRQGGYNNYRQQGGYNNQRPYQQRPVSASSPAGTGRRDGQRREHPAEPGGWIQAAQQL